MEEETLLISNFEKLSEDQCKEWMSSLGLSMVKVPKRDSKTPDYEIPSMDIGVECSVVYQYTNAEPLRDLYATLSKKSGIEEHVKLIGDEKGSKISVEHLDTFKREDNLTVLRIEYDLSAVRKKNSNKLEKEIGQCRGYEKCLLILDYRYFMFDSSALVDEWKGLLHNLGQSYPKLIGVIIATMKNPEDKIITDPPLLRFIRNKHSPYKPPDEFADIEIPDDRYNVKSFYYVFFGDMRRVKKYQFNFKRESLIRIHTVEGNIKYCDKCGEANRRSAKFCVRCGTEFWME